VVVVGNGMAGSRFVQELVERDLDRRLDITVIGDEPGGAYNRMLLSNVLAGTTAAQDIELASESWYERHAVTLRTGTPVVGIDRKSQFVELVGGESIRYDALVLATGSDPVVPPVPGLHRASGEPVDGVVPFRTSGDCTEIRRRAERARAAVVVGGGVLGLEAARGLVGLGVPVTVVERGTRLMEQQLDSGAARVLARAVERTGVTAFADIGVVEVVGDPVQAVLLSDGRRIDADLLVLCCGVRPRVALAVDADLAVERAIVVGDDLRSVSDRNVFAIGECAEHRGRTYGLVAPAWEQARIAAEIVAGGIGTYTGSAIVTRLKAAGIELATMGETTSDDEDDVCFVDGQRGVYQKLVVRDGRLVGAILLGDTRTVGTVTQLYDRGATVPIDRAGLLLTRRAGGSSAEASPTLLPDSATICHCNGVSKGSICSAWQGGARTIAEIADRTRATTGCGTCRESVVGIADWLAAADPDQAVPPEDTVVPSADIEAVPA
jgi:assimilatory nitrate reductase electron transfer subunit